MRIFAADRERPGRQSGFEWFEFAEELEPVVFESFEESLQKQSTEQARQNTYGQKEAGAAADPVAIGTNAAPGDDEVNVGMMQQILSPGMKNAEEADVRAEVLRIARDGEQRFGRGAEEDAVHRLLVVKGEAGDLLRQREDDVEVLTLIAAGQVTLSPDKQSHATSLVVRQQFSLPAFEPLHAIRALTFRAVAVAAGVIAVARVTALAAFFGMPPSAEVRQSWIARMTRNCWRGSLRVLRYCSPYCRKMSASS